MITGLTQLQPKNANHEALPKHDTYGNPKFHMLLPSNMRTPGTLYKKPIEFLPKAGLNLSEVPSPPRGLVSPSLGSAQGRGLAGAEHAEMGQIWSHVQLGTYNPWSWEGDWSLCIIGPRSKKL